MVAVHTTVIYNSFLHYSSLTTVNPKQYKNHTFKNMTNNNKKINKTVHGHCSRCKNQHTEIYQLQLQRAAQVYTMHSSQTFTQNTILPDVVTCLNVYL